MFLAGAFFAGNAVRTGRANDVGQDAIGAPTGWQPDPAAACTVLGGGKDSFGGNSDAWFVSAVAVATILAVVSR